MMKFKILLFVLMHSFLSIGQTQNIQKSDSNVKIYSYKNKALFTSNKDKKEIWWFFFKVDWDERTIQSVEFVFEEGGKFPDLSNVNKLFKITDIDEFIILSPHKIKVRGQRGYRQRGWFDFATPGVKIPAIPARKYFFKGDTLTGKNKNLKFVLDKDLTTRYQEQKRV
ncbi:hypothetical protein [Flavobacterium hercynium]|uniref:Uncharacterized protein n=1 Tax=Flavobacterium hercynium TaxID=387094 RepID=A0A226H412_9FLAO|nr:hypothetical protein [Flavobacterium hercynium]OXA88401.1 hypothetical protein B0A66_15805 [Flavobacterium hercynium]